MTRSVKQVLKSTLNVVIAVLLNIAAVFDYIPAAPTRSSETYLHKTPKRLIGKHVSARVDKSLKPKMKSYLLKVKQGKNMLRRRSPRSHPIKPGEIIKRDQTFIKSQMLNGGSEIVIVGSNTSVDFPLSV